MTQRSTLDSLKFVVPTALLLTAFVLAGCGGHDMALISHGGKLAIRSQTNKGVTLAGGFSTGIYSYDDKNNLTVLLFNGPADNPTQAVTVRMFWRPRAGRTPIAPAATNATIHYIIFAGGESAQVGVYDGAGFMFPNSKPGAAKLDAGIWQATLRLSDSSKDFNDLLGQAVLEGDFAAKRDDLAVNQTLRRLNVLIRDRLGYPRLVAR